MKVTKQDYQQYLEHPTKELRDKLIIANIWLVKKMANYYGHRAGLKVNELESYGYEALIKAVDLFDPTRGTEFSSYASRAIKYKMLDGICELRGYKTDDKEHYVFYNKLQQLKKEFRNDIDDYKTLCNIILAEMDLNLKAETKLRIRLALDTKKSKLEQIERGTQDEFDDPAHALAVYEDIKRKLNEAVDSLRITHQTTIKKHYGLQGETPLSTGQIGKEYHVPKQRIQSYEKLGLEKLRKFLGEEGTEMLEFFYENPITPSQVQKVKR